mmetsp:Transcript_19066/g.54027  ORF Transcript_19066/g.54027 Transcript_19066/m.54027 type:complete len:145 (-) Transcript_19066:514-948(-)
MIISILKRMQENLDAGMKSMKKDLRDGFVLGPAGPVRRRALGTKGDNDHLCMSTWRATFAEGAPVTFGRKPFAFSRQTRPKLQSRTHRVLARDNAARLSPCVLAAEEIEKATACSHLTTISSTSQVARASIRRRSGLPLPILSG